MGDDIWVQGSAGEDRRPDRDAELFVLQSDPYALCRETVADRKFESRAEWNEFVNAVRAGEAYAKAYNQFPYKRKRNGDTTPESEWEVEREYWFEWETEKKPRHIVVHAHSSVLWIRRDSTPIGPVTQLNVRHCNSSKEFVDEPSCSIRKQTESKGTEVGSWGGAGLYWDDVDGADNDDVVAVRDVLRAGEAGCFRMSHAKAWRNLKEEMERTQGQYSLYY